MTGAPIRAPEIIKSVELVTDPYGVETVMGADIAENVLEL
jgi:hypothetical protein